MRKQPGPIAAIAGRVDRGPLRRITLCLQFDAVKLGIDMTFRVIEGGLAVDGRTAGDRIDAGQVSDEGARRLRQAGYDRLDARRRVTGLGLPRALDHFRMQIEFAISALSRLDPIPPDFRHDGYWPIFDKA